MEMARPGVEVSPGEARRPRRHAVDFGFDFDSLDDGVDLRSPSGGVPGRRTVTITGHGAEGYASRNGTRPSMAQRHRQIKRHERDGFRPDRVAMWAVLLGVILLLAAATSSHAAVLVAHHALSLR